MSSQSPNDYVDGLLAGRVVIRIPDNYDDTCAFLEQLEKAAPDLTWNNGDLLTDFIPRQNEKHNNYFHINTDRRNRPCGGLMWDSADYLITAMPGVQFVDHEDVFKDSPADCSDFLTELL